MKHNIESKLVIENLLQFHFLCRQVSLLCPSEISDTVESAHGVQNASHSNLQLLLAAV